MPTDLNSPAVGLGDLAAMLRQDRIASSIVVAAACALPVSALLQRCAKHSFES